MALPEGWEVEPLPAGWEEEKPTPPAPPESIRDVLARKFAADTPLGMTVRTLAPQISAVEALYGGAKAPLAGIRAFGQGASGRLTDEAAGVVGAMNELQGRHPITGSVAKALSGPILGPASSMTPGNEQFPNEGLVDALSKRYASERDLERGAIEKARVDLPLGAYRTLETAGGLVMPGTNIGKVGTVADFARAAGTGAAQGGIMGFGGASGGLASQAIDTATGAAAGGILTPVLGAAATKGGDYLKPAMERAAQTKGIEAINNTKGQIIDRMAKVLKTSDVNVQRRFAQRLLDEGVISLGDSAESITKKAQARADALGPQIGAFIDKAETGFDANVSAAEARNAAKLATHKTAKDAATARLESATTPAEFNAARASMPKLDLEPVPSMQEEFRKMGGAVRGSMADRPNIDRTFGGPAVERVASAIETEPAPTMRKLQESKSSLQGKVAQPTTLEREMLGDASREATDSYYSTIEGALSPDEAAAFRPLNRKFADMRNAVDIAGNRASREETAKAGTQAGTEAAKFAAEQVGGGAGAVAGFATKMADKLFQRRGAATMASGLNMASKVVPGSPAAQYIAGQGLKWSALQSLLSPDEQKRKSEEAMAAADRGTPK